jgi:ABC-2 type transport system permease protein
MLTIWSYTLARFRGQVLGWGAGLFLLGLLSLLRSEMILENREQIQLLLKGSAGKLIAMVTDLEKLTSPEGILSLSFFAYMPLILGVFAVLAGSGLLAADEEAGTLDLVLAHPLSRTALFAGRLLGFTTALAAILALSWLGFVVGLGRSSLAVGPFELALPYLSLLAVLLFFGTLALLLATLLPSRRAAAMTAGMVLVASFFLTTLARLDPGLETLARLSPVGYYQSGEAIRGLNGGWFAGLLAGAGLFAALAWWRFQRRDIRVAGEGAWRWRPWRRATSSHGPRPCSPASPRAAAAERPSASPARRP